MSELRTSRAQEWSDLLEVLHHVANTITVRAHYGEGHPAVAQADLAVERGFARVLEQEPEVLLALVDGEFVVSERPMPLLRQRMHALGDAMMRHEIQCIVFERGVRRDEATVLAQLLASAPEPGHRARELAQQRMVHVLFRYLGQRASELGAGEGTGSAYLLPATEEVLVGVARALATGAPVDVPAVLSLATRIVSLARAQAISLDQRAWTRSISDETAHASNVAQLTAAMVLDARYPEKECIDVTAAALLHDVGHLFVPEDIRGVPEPLLDVAQRPVFRNHTYAGASLLLSAGCPPLWVAVAFEHHRGVDGGGYPLLDGKAVPPHELVRIVALANYVDRKLTRLSGQADEPDAVVRAAAELEPRFFGPGLVNRLLRSVGVFPPGTTVELSDREPAIVARANVTDPLRPQVRILRGGRASKLVDLRDAAPAEGRFARSIVRAALPPLFLPSDLDARAQHEAEEDEDTPAPEVPAEDPNAFVDDPWSMVTPVRKRPTRRPPASGPTSEEVARRELSGMSSLLDDLLTVPAEALAAPAPPPRPSPLVSMPSIPAPTISIAPDRRASTSIPAVHVTVPPGAMESVRPPASRPSEPAFVAPSVPPPRVAPRLSTPPGAPTDPPPGAASPEDIEVLMMVGDWASALAACDAWLASHEGDAEVLELRKRCVDSAPELAASPASPASLVDVGAMHGAVPSLAMPESATYALPLGSEARFVLTLVDGVSTLETIADASGLPTERAHEILGDLIARGVLAVP